MNNQRFRTVATLRGYTLFTPGTVTLNAAGLSDFCYQFEPGTNSIRVEVILDSYRSCKPRGMSAAIPVCNPSPVCPAGPEGQP
jgi:hypothetical protein